ncbi:MAG: alpha-amylase family glycosyl hydrolase [Opitutales bacterium]
MPEIDLAYEAERSLRRIRPRILEKIEAAETSAHGAERLEETLELRLKEHWPQLFRLLYRLYGEYYDFFYYLENILLTAVDCWLTRSEELLQLDLRRENDPGWYLSEKMVGASLYVDRFAGDIKHLREKIPYLKDLGITYLHLMPVFATRTGNNDGGYAISDYRSVDPGLGTMDELRELAKELRKVGISLVLDFIFNHTSDDHEWAIRAQEGEREYRDYYYIFKDRTIPDQYEQHLREIFPAARRGNFTWHSGLKRWVWTTFNSFQWDLKYANPEVFRAMAAEMLFLANTGVEILRLDAVAFIWKRMGTSCENLPEAHCLIQAFNSLCRIAAPSLVFKSEAIVHPDEVLRYIGRDECQLSYNPTLMALLWESVATRETKLLEQSLARRHNLPVDTNWVNYLRGHDDIGWSFDDEDARAVGIHPPDHRDFLNRFYTGRFPGTFASGVPFQHNEDTGDMRVSGTMASLAGLEQALERRDPVLTEMALRRIRMLYGVLCSIGGIPLIFAGDEWGMLNDYNYINNPEIAGDTRWVHRPKMDWSVLEELNRKGSAKGRIFSELEQIFEVRKKNYALTGNRMRLLPTSNPHVLAYLRWHDANVLVVIANFSEYEQEIGIREIRTEGLGRFVKDLFAGNIFSTHDPVKLDAYEFLWLEED